MVWYSHLFQNFPQFIVIHTVKGFGIVNKAEIDVSLKHSCFFKDPADVGNFISGSTAQIQKPLSQELIVALQECKRNVFRLFFFFQEKAKPKNFI